MPQKVWFVSGSVRTGRPHRGAAGHPRVAGPRFVPSLSRAWNRVEPPDLLAGPRIECGEKSPDTKLAAHRPHDDFVLHDQRCDGEPVAGLRPGAADSDVPHQSAGGRVDREHVAVERSHEQRVAEDCQAAVHAAAARTRERGGRVRVDPEHASGRRVECDDVVRRLNRVQHAVHDERCGFELLERQRLEHPANLEVLDVARRHLSQRRVALAHHAARIAQPVLGLRPGAQDPIEGHAGVPGRRLLAEGHGLQPQ